MAQKNWGGGSGAPSAKHASVEAKLPLTASHRLANTHRFLLHQQLLTLQHPVR